MTEQETLSPQERYELITRGVEEVIGGEIIQQVLDANERPLKCYWGTAPTGRPHVGYFVPLTKLADFLRAGVQVKVLFADIHAFLDNMKAPIELVKHRAEYYRQILTCVMKSIGVPTDRLTFVLGSSYELSEQYNFDVYRLAAMVTEHDAKKAGAEVVKQVASPLLSGLLYPGLQALDEQYLDVDFQFGGLDQRKIFMFAEQYLPKLGYAKRAHVMNGMVPGMNGSKMSSSDKDSKIDFLDTPSEVLKKVKAAYCMEGEVDNNGVLAFVGAVLMPIARMRQEMADKHTPLDGQSRSFIAPEAPKGTLFSIMRPEKFGGPLYYSAYDDLVSDFKEKKVHPADLKPAVADALNTLLEPVQKLYETEEFKKIKALAYPDEEPKAKKVKAKKLNPMVAPYFTKEEGGTAETPEEAAANAKAAGFEYKQRKGKKGSAQKQEDPTEAMQNMSVNP